MLGPVSFGSDPLQAQKRYVLVFSPEHFCMEPFSVVKELASWSLRHRRQLQGKAVIFQTFFSPLLHIFALFRSSGKCDIVSSVGFSLFSPILP